jgi:hypothetical protein
MQRVKHESSVANGPHKNQSEIFLNFRTCKKITAMNDCERARARACVCMWKRWGFHTDIFQDTKLTMHILAKGFQRKIPEKYVTSEEQSRGQKIKVEYILSFNEVLSCSSSLSVDGICIIHEYWMLLTGESRSSRRETSLSATFSSQIPHRLTPKTWKSEFAIKYIHDAATCQ